MGLKSWPFPTALVNFGRFFSDDKRSDFSHSVRFALTGDNRINPLKHLIRIQQLTSICFSHSTLQLRFQRFQ